MRPLLPHAMLMRRAEALTLICSRHAERRACHALTLQRADVFAARQPFSRAIDYLY